MAQAGMSKLEPHPAREAALAEIHARPFAPMVTPGRVLHFAFAVDAAATAAASRALAELARSRGLPPIDEGARQVSIDLAPARLVFEPHGEFLTYTWIFAGQGDRFRPPPNELASVMTLVPQPGPLLVAIDLHLLPQSAAPADLDEIFPGAAVAASEVDDGRALIASDFRADAFGFVRMLVFDRTLSPASAGALVQRLIEIETYRLLALAGLPTAQKLAPSVRRIERALPEMLRAMNDQHGLEANRAMLDQLTALATELESGAAEGLYRFGATRAYGELVRLRLDAIKETRIPHHSTFASFLARRFEPALRTCASLEERQASLSTKIARFAELLRTRVDVEMESQNFEELRQMADRQLMQLRLQQTVEGLSIAAITYYVSSVLHLLFEGAHAWGLHVDASVATALAVPVIAVAVAIVVWRIRHAHGGDK